MGGLDLKKLREEAERFDDENKQEHFRDLPEEIIHLLNNDIINYVLHHTKTSKSKDIPARVLNNWIKEEVVIIDEKYKGKNKRFDKVQCIWLNIVEDARKFGVFLDDLKTVHRKIVMSKIPNFSYLKLGILNTVLVEPQILEMQHCGSCHIETESYYKPPFFRGKILPHIIFPLTDLIKKEFPKSNFELPIKIIDWKSNQDKMVMLFLLKTFCYEYMKIYISRDDVRLIENSEIVIKNKDIHQTISTWNFHKIEIYFEDGVMAVIEGNL